MSTGPSSPAAPLYASPEQRFALARRRFFEEGARPSGVVSEAVIQSRSRCLRTHPDPARPAVFEPVTWRSREGRRPVHCAGMDPSPPGPSTTPPLPVSPRDTERETVMRVLAECDGNVSKAARTLGVSRGLIYRHLRQDN